MRIRVVLLMLLGIFIAPQISRGGQSGSGAFRPDVPKTWDDAALATLEIPLAASSASAKHVSAEYYYKLPIRPIYKTYPIYAPGHEPAAYLAWLRQQEPVILWDDKGHSPTLVTQADWIQAGKMAFDAPVVFGSAAGYTVEEVRDPSWYRKNGVPLTRDGVMPFFQYAIREKGKIENALRPDWKRKSQRTEDYVRAT